MRTKSDGRGRPYDVFAAYVAITRIGSTTNPSWATHKVFKVIKGKELYSYVGFGNAKVVVTLNTDLLETQVLMAQWLHKKQQDHEARLLKYRTPTQNA